MPSYHQETTGALKANDDYVGQSHDLIDDKYLLAFAHADEDGTIQVEQSPNKRDWYVLEEKDLNADESIRLVSESVCRYARVYYENGNARQNTFRLLTCSKGAR